MGGGRCMKQKHTLAQANLGRTGMLSIKPFIVIDAGKAQQLNRDSVHTAAQRWTVDKMDAYKHDQGKPRLALVPPGAIEAIGIVRTYGVNKYGEEES